MESPIEKKYLSLLEERIKTSEKENVALQKELSIKNMISEIYQYQTGEEEIDSFYYKIYASLSDIIIIDNFYICFVEEDFVNIPFFIDQYDQFDSKTRYEKNNPKLKQSLTKYALDNGKTLTLTREEISNLEQEHSIKLIGKRPEQWIYVPFHNKSLVGGLVAQSYNRNFTFTHTDISILAYVSMHIGNFISSVKSREKITRQYEELKSAQSQLVHSEKMASIGQLAAGVAHEINNPIGYINSNLNTLKDYIHDISAFFTSIEKVLTKLNADEDIKNVLLKEFTKAKEDNDIDFLFEDIGELVKESISGMQKVKTIVLGLKNFSHSGGDVMQAVDINENIEDTIRIVWNELKYHCEIDKNLAELPLTYCHSNQLNQVFMNLLVNAGHAIKERGIIKVRTWREDNIICVEIEDNGTGIKEEHLNQLFNPFFTTKPVGQGTGLGLSISYGIIQNHHGNIEVSSQLGTGTCFKVSLPILDKPQ